MAIFRNTAMRRLVLLVLLGVVPMSVAANPILSAPEVQEQVSAGDTILLDIRAPQEWADTGVAEGAWPVSMHDPAFGANLQAILAEIPAEKIALICATGGRTAHVVSVLKQNGIEGIADVSEGMMGNPRGPGWIARGMPLVTGEQAAKAFEAVKAGW